MVERRALLHPGLVPALRGRRRSGHEQDPVLLGTVDPEVDVGPALPPERLQRVLAAGRRFLEGPVELGEVLLADGEDQVGLVGEMQVDRRWGHADGVGHRPDRDRLLVACFPQEPFRGGEDLLPQLPPLAAGRPTSPSYSGVGDKNIGHT